MAFARPHSYLRLLSSHPLAVSLFVLASMSAAPACAQIVVNDPAAMLSMPKRFVMTPSERAAAKAIESGKAVPGSSPAIPVQKTIKDLPQQLEPQLDLDIAPIEKANPGVEEDNTIKARAVMVDINSTTLNYDKDRDVYVASGGVHMIISEQNSELYADKLTYDQNQGLAIAEGHVVIIKNGQRTDGTYAKIDLTRKSALINDTMTTISMVRVKAKQSFVNNNELQLEDGRMIISGLMYQQFVKNGGLSAGLAQSTGKGANQARLQRAYSKQLYANRKEMMSQMSYYQQQQLKELDALDPTKADFNDSPDKISKLRIKAKEIDIVRNDDGYDRITLHHPSLYYGKFKLGVAPDVDFSYDEPSRQVQYLGPDIGSNRAYGGIYAGPGWDFHLGRGSLRISPVASFGSPGFFAADGRNGKQVSNGFGFGGALHFRDPDTTIDLAYNSKVGVPVFFADRRLIGENIHVMGSYGDSYVNGLLGQVERPTYIAQITDYRVLKNMGKFQLSSFESLGFAKDNFYPNFRETYFVKATGADPKTLGRAQIQLQLQNTAPLLRIGKVASFGLRAQLLGSAYTSADYVALGRIGPTMNLNFMDGKLQSSVAYTLSHSIGKSPFVFDSYYGGAQNVSLNNQLRVTKFLSLGTINSFSLNRDNAKNALAVGNSIYMMVGPEDVKATIGYDFVNSRSFFGFNYYPGPNNTVVDYDKMKITQPGRYNQAQAISKF
jgi:hypothetical protein